MKSDGHAVYLTTTTTKIKVTLFDVSIYPTSKLLKEFRFEFVLWHLGNVVGYIETSNNVYQLLIFLVKKEVKLHKILLRTNSKMTTATTTKYPLLVTSEDKGWIVIFLVLTESGRGIRKYFAEISRNFTETLPPSLPLALL